MNIGLTEYFLSFVYNYVCFVILVLVPKNDINI
jgi:hypothetical protein